MKKILLTTATLATIASSAFAAEHDTPYTHSDIYMRLDMLGQKFKKTSINSNIYKNKNYSYGLDLGLGYHITKKIRAEIVYNHNFITRFKNNLSKGKADTKAIFVRSMLDVITFEKAQLFIGAGAGFARTGYKLNGRTYKAKAKNNFAYSFHAGGAIDIAEGVMLETSWGMRNYGATGALTDKESNVTLDQSKVKLRSQLVSLGLRFDV